MGDGSQFEEDRRVEDVASVLLGCLKVNKYKKGPITWG